MPCAFNCLSDLALELQGRTGETAGQNLALLVEVPLEELSVLVVHLFDVSLLETAVFFLLHLYCRRVEISDFVVYGHGLFLLCCVS